MDVTSSGSNVVDELITNQKYGNFLRNLMKDVMKPEFNELKETVAELRNDVHELKLENRELRNEIENLKTENEKIQGEMHDIQVDKEKLQSENQSLKLHVESIQYTVIAQRELCLDLQQYTRRNCMVVNGIAESEGENTDQKIKNVIKDKLDIELGESDIDRTHRIGKSFQGKPRAIVVKLTRYNIRQKIMKNRKMLKGSNIFINELLTPFTSKLLKRAKDLVREAFWVKSAWTWDGRVYIYVHPAGQDHGKKILVKSETDLRKTFSVYASQHRELQSQNTGDSETED